MIYFCQLMLPVNKADVYLAKCVINITFSENNETKAPSLWFPVELGASNFLLPASDS